MPASQAPPSPLTHNQPLPNPLAHFHSIPWCHALLTHRSILHIAIRPIPDRTALASTESSLVRETLNTPRTVYACVTFLLYVKEFQPDGASISKEEKEAARKTEMQARGEEKENPFQEYGALVDLRDGVNGYKGTAHGGFSGWCWMRLWGLRRMLRLISLTGMHTRVEHGALTASLTVNFKKPLYTPRVVVVRGRVVDKKGRKLTVKGSLADGEGNVLAEADGVWIMANGDIGRWTDAKL
ncbi:hypothetical protein LOCC1_G003433 [Lachnellula occidentalis]|uniref:Thioesterase domain-containing protein n=1 Tax=Lachnellula occidentalis TaxID=215460 RepID=A0A8H8UJM4_9HELO|nr:hypothetical protein LOCC1_G003433 [Lachnellula occidentalis]